MSDQVNQSQPLAKERGETLRAAQGDGQSCVVGRELNATILERVFGHSRPDPIIHQLEYDHLPIRRDGWTWINGEWIPFDNYSTEIAAAMQIVDTTLAIGG